MSILETAFETLLNHKQHLCFNTSYDILFKQPILYKYFLEKSRFETILKQSKAQNTPNTALLKRFKGFVSDILRRV